MAQNMSRTKFTILLNDWAHARCKISLCSHISTLNTFTADYTVRVQTRVMLECQDVNGTGYSEFE